MASKGGKKENRTREKRLVQTNPDLHPLRKYPQIRNSEKNSQSIILRSSGGFGALNSFRKEGHIQS